MGNKEFIQNFGGKTSWKKGYVENQEGDVRITLRWTLRK
jgi:hypothetical protein